MYYVHRRRGRDRCFIDSKKRDGNRCSLKHPRFRGFQWSPCFHWFVRAQSRSSTIESRLPIMEAANELQHTQSGKYDP